LGTIEAQILLEDEEDVCTPLPVICNSLRNRPVPCTTTLNFQTPPHIIGWTDTRQMLDEGIIKFFNDAADEELRDHEVF